MIIKVKIAHIIAALALVLAGGTAASVLASPAVATNGGHEKVGVCHRTGSESNPYVFISVPKDEANGHITGTGKQHNEKIVWKADGTWRGVPHKAGDLKLDYYADSKSQCNDTKPSPTTTKPCPTTKTTTPTQTHSTSSTTSSTSSTTTQPTTTQPPTTTMTTKPTTATKPPTTKPTTKTHKPTATKPVKPTKTKSSEAPSSPSTSPTGGIPASLAFTGVNVAKVLLLAAVLLIVGGLLYFVTRRRKH